jgi:hypothetical protein
MQLACCLTLKRPVQFRLLTGKIYAQSELAISILPARREAIQGIVLIG